ncbi:DUF2500 family protein [Oceanisphaera avium]|uniref:DUF2500 domain-containing protein n=1 Tax=Oceanisphaera avium TaxID=1903694 RepID=A0A1Y0D002_9GAMM|nr:DUF2500 family protein [Oceanisphaera avium]ART80564.1 hypothetical protein CBP12_10785 [Oceanisphaera avium]
MGRFVFWGIILIAIFVLARRVSSFWFNQRQASHSVAVLVQEKHYREFMGQTHKQQTEPPAPRVNYYVTFRPLEDAPAQEFQVSQLIYEQLEPEQTGTLIIKGTRFIAFEPDANQ